MRDGCFDCSTVHQIFRIKPILSKPLTIDPELEILLHKAKECFQSLSDVEKRELLKQPAQSFIRAEMGFGSDADEAAYTQAYLNQDLKELKRLDLEAKARIEQTDKILNSLFSN